MTTTLTGQVQASLAPLNDPNGAHANLLAAYAAMGEQVFSIVVDQGSPDVPASYTAGWSILLDPDVCPAQFLPYCALFNGTVVPPGTDEVTARALIKAEGGQQRGTPPAIVSAAKRFLTGTQSVTLNERASATGTLDAYHFVLTVLASEAQPTNLIANPSFEYDTAGSAPYWWSQNTGGTATITTFQVRNEWAATGSRSLRMTATGATPLSGVFAISPALSVTVGSNYGTLATFDLLTASTSAGLSLAWYNSGGTNFHTDSTAAAGVGTHTLSVSAVAPAGAVTVKVEAEIYNSGASTGSVDGYVDGLVLQPIAPAGAPSYGDGDSIGWQWSGTPGQSTSQRNIQPLIDSVNTVKPAGLQWTLNQVATWTVGQLEAAYPSSISSMESAFATVGGLENDEGGM